VRSLKLEGLYDKPATQKTTPSRAHCLQTVAINVSVLSMSLTASIDWSVTEDNNVNGVAVVQSWASGTGRVQKEHRSSVRIRETARVDSLWWRFKVSYLIWLRYSLSCKFTPYTVHHCDVIHAYGRSTDNSCNPGNYNNNYYNNHWFTIIIRRRRIWLVTGYLIHFSVAVGTCSWNLAVEIVKTDKCGLEVVT